MTIKAKHFTPEALLSAPRRLAGAPNPAGDKALYTVSTYSFQEHRKTAQIHVLDIARGEPTVLYEGAAYSEPVWVGDDEFFFLKSGDKKGTTTLLVGRASRPGAAPTEIQTLDGSFSNLRVLPLEDGALAIALTGLADPSGKPARAEDDAAAASSKPDGAKSGGKAKATRYSTGRVYTQLYVRHWDAYVTESTQAIWYGRVDVSGPAAGAGPRSYALAAGRITNLLAGTGLESPVPPFGGTGDFALGPRGIAFVARDPRCNPALTTVSNLYFVPLTTFAEPAPAAAPRAVRTGSLQGYSASPVFSPDGRSLVFTRMASAQYESDKPRLLLVDDVAGDRDADAVEYYASKDGLGAWDVRPDSILWSADGSELFVTGELCGRNALFRLPARPDEAAAHGLPEVLLGGHEVLAPSSGEAATAADNGPDEGDLDPAHTRVTGFRPLRGHGSVSDVRLLAGGGGGRLFVTMSSLIDSSLYVIVDPGCLAPSKGTPSQQTPPPEKALGSRRVHVPVDVVSSLSRHGAAFGLAREQLGEIWFRGGGGDDGDSSYHVHALVVRPSSFSADKTYPLALLIHGGPQGAWGDSWSTRWNPAVFAEQGYVVVAPNPTGSTGYGMALENGIQNQWGGRPYEDLVRCVDHVAATLPYVDRSRAVALGASYGGYMINWIQGHPLGRRFQALVCHDGVFSTLNQYASEELFFPLHDFGGTLWENRAGYEAWDPAKHTGAWATPMLVIHNELDYRLPITEGLAMFNVLQSRNVPSRLLSFPDENHWVLKPENSLQWHQEVLAWINKYAQPERPDPSRLAESVGRIRVAS